MKKGFTLVELLAVIAILAILVIIALPNVIGMFNTAKENSFKTEVKEIFKTAQQQWIQDSMYSTDEQTYRRCSGCSGKSLNLSGRSELEYYIRLNKAGKVVEYYATDGTFQYSFSDPDGLEIEKIDTVQKIAEISTNEVVDISNAGSNGTNTNPKTYVYVYTESKTCQIGSALPDGLTTYNSAYDVTAANANRIFIKHAIENGIITESYVGFYYTGSSINSEQLIQGGNTSTYNENKTSLLSEWNSSNCSDNSTYFECYFSNLGLKTYTTGRAISFEDRYYCEITDTGQSICKYGRP